MRRLFTAAVLILSLSGFALPANAAGGINLDPSVIRLTMKPGELWRGTVWVTDGMGVPATLIISPANISRTEESDTVDLSGDITSRLGTLAAWVRPAADTLTVPAGSRVALGFSIQVPENAPPGIHKGLLVLTLAPAAPQSNTLAATAAIALGIDLTVVGQPNHHIALQDVSASPRIGTKPPVTALATVVNSGNTLPVVDVTARISNLWGSQALVDMKPVNGSVLVAPGTETLFEGTWDGAGIVPIGIFKLSVIARDSAGSHEASTYFILVPWQILGGLFVALILIVAGSRYAARKRSPAA